MPEQLGKQRCEQLFKQDQKQLLSSPSPSPTTTYSPSTPPSPTSTAAGDTVDGVDLLIEAERRIRAEAAEADRTHNRVDEEHRTRFYHRAIGLRQAANLVRTVIDEQRGVVAAPEHIEEKLAAWAGEQR